MTSSDPEDPTDRSGRTGGDRAEPVEGRASDSPVARRAELPPDVNAAFAAIVAGWAADGAPAWPAAEPGTTERGPGAQRDPSTEDGPSSGIGTATPPRGWTPGEAPVGPAPRDRADDVAVPPRRDPDTPPPAAHRPYPAPPPEEDHFVPPEPPPLPRVRFSAVLGLLLLVFGVVLLALPGLVGASLGLGLVPGLLAMAAGLGWLVIGLRRTHDDDSDDGAVV